VKRFLTVWLGQLVSLIGTGLTDFALGVWMFQTTGSVTQLALVSICTVVPGVLIAPVAGALVDRWDRRLTLIISTAAAAMSVLSLAILAMLGLLAPAPVYLAVAVSSVCMAFQRPAFAASTVLLAPPEQLGRANGMVQMALAAAQLLSPVLAGVLVVGLGIQGVFGIDFASFLVAIGTLVLVPFPRLAGAPAQRSALAGEITATWTYLRARRGLIDLMLLLAVANFLAGFVMVLATPLVLSFTSAAVLGTIVSFGGSGMLVGALVMSAWGGPRRRMDGVLGFLAVSGIGIALGGLRPSPVLVGLGAFLFFFGVPLINGCANAILQVKVVPAMQGRVFAGLQMITGLALPLAYVIAGPLADHVFEPLMSSSSAVALGVGQLIGTGPGRGIGLLFVILGVSLAVLASVTWLAQPRLRRLEALLPDATPVGISLVGSRS
jgi:MFS family permease